MGACAIVAVYELAELAGETGDEAVVLVVAEAELA
jgi:hypothetical protein